MNTPLIGVSVLVFAAVVFLIIQGGSKFVMPKTQKEKVREQVDNMLLRDPEVPLERKAEIVADRAVSAVDRLVNPVSPKEKAAELEAKRLAYWKANFPWKPTHDPMCSSILICICLGTSILLKRARKRCGAGRR